MMKKLLLTGFEPFLDNPINPTAKIIEALDGKTIASWTVEGKLLPVDFHQAGKHVLEAIQTHQPDAVISLGLAAGRQMITPERIAINCQDGAKDNAGYIPLGEKIQETGADGYFSTLPIQAMVNKLHANTFPARISNTAGTYVCNHVMYQVLHACKQQEKEIPAGFIHIPASHELALKKTMPSWSQSDLTKAVELIITCLDEG